jgi:hypothetical protein
MLSKQTSIMLTNNHTRRNIFNDISLWSLLLSNIVTIFLAITEHWNLSTIMWVYWFQSIIIGFFNFIRILQLKKFSTERLIINGQPAQPTQSTKISTAFFFLFHYGFFHLIYLVFLLSNSFIKGHGNTSNLIESKYIFITALIFFINHLFSYFYNRPRDTKKQNIGSLMLYPYARIIPMHLTIIFSSSLVGALPFFLLLKTMADAIMHILEHNVLKKGEAQQT